MSTKMMDRQTSSGEIRALSTSEIDEVNGGLIFLALGLVAAFEVGVIAGAIAANYKLRGNLLGD